MPQAPRLGPDDLAGLSVSALVDAKEWLAVAAYATASPQELPNTLQKLATACADPGAFEWFWALVHRPNSQNVDAGWSAFAQLPDVVSVPKDLHDAVMGFVIAPSPGPTARGRAGGELLPRLPASLASEAARKALKLCADSSTRPSQEVIDAAISQLSGGRRGSDRALVIEVTRQRTPQEQLAFMCALTGEPLPGELDELERRVAEVLSSCAPTDPVVTGHATAVWRFLSPDVRRRLMTGPLTSRPEIRATFLTTDLLQPDGVNAALILLDPDLDSDGHVISVPHVVETIQRLIGESGGFGVELLEAAHDRLCVGDLAPVRARLTQLIPSMDDDTRHAAEAALLRVALNSGDKAAHADARDGMRPGDLPTAFRSVKVTTSSNASQLGNWLADYLEAGPTTSGQTAVDSRDQRVSDIASIVQAISTRQRATVVKALAESSETQLPLRIVAATVNDSRLVAALASTGHSAEILDLVEREKDAAPTGPAFSAALLTIAQHADDFTDGSRATDLAEKVLDELDQEQGVEATAHAVVRALHERPARLTNLTLSQIRTLAGPQAHMAPPQRLTILLDAALPHIACAPDANDCLELLAEGHPLLHAHAAKWLAAAEPTAELVALGLRADTSSSQYPSLYSQARTGQAGRLVEVASNVQKGTGDRTAALDLALLADPDVARNTALQLIDPHTPKPVRAAAAQVLADTTGSHDDVEAIQQRIATESDAAIAETLRKALRRIQSGDAGEALRNLIGFLNVDLDPDSLDLEVVLPYQGWHDAFIAAVDRSRSNLAGDPDNAILHLNKLAELLVELAFVAYANHQGNPKEKEKAGKILVNSHGKPDAGSLVTQQGWIERFPWFTAVASLRQVRVAHAAPAGSTQPLNLSDDHVTAARVLMGTIVTGWCHAMLDNPPKD